MLGIIHTECMYPPFRCRKAVIHTREAKSQGTVMQSPLLSVNETQGRVAHLFQKLEHGRFSASKDNRFLTLWIGMWVEDKLSKGQT